MKCRKCNNELSQDSKFCNLCGTQIELSTLELSDKLVDYTQKIYFLLGWFHGMHKENPKDKELEEVYNKLKTNYDFSEIIERIIKFWKNAGNDKQGKE